MTRIQAIQIASPLLAENVEDLVRLAEVEAAEIVIANAIGALCAKCGELWGSHRGTDAACQHARWRELGQPLYVEGQFFSVTPNRCEAIEMQNSEDRYGTVCGRKCEPGKHLCLKHYAD